MIHNCYISYKMQTRSKREHFKIDTLNTGFIQQTYWLVEQVKSHDITTDIQLVHVINLFTHIEQNIVQYFNTEIVHNPEKDEWFLQFVNVVYKKAKELYDDITKILWNLPKNSSHETAELCCSAMYAITRARNEIFMIVEPYHPPRNEEIKVVSIIPEGLFA